MYIAMSRFCLVPCYLLRPPKDQSFLRNEESFTSSHNFTATVLTQKSFTKISVFNVTHFFQPMVFRLKKIMKLRKVKVKDLREIYRRLTVITDRIYLIHLIH